MQYKVTNPDGARIFEKFVDEKTLKGLILGKAPKDAVMEGVDKGRAIEVDYAGIHGFIFYQDLAEILVDPPDQPPAQDKPFTPAGECPMVMPDGSVLHNQDQITWI